MKYEKPDGTIEFGFSACCCKPGESPTGGQHTNATTNWWRIVGEGWHHCIQRSVERKLADNAKTCAEFKERIERQYANKS